MTANDGHPAPRSRLVPVPIADPGDPRLADYRGVREPAWLRERGRFVAESRHVVRRLLASPRFPLRSLWLNPAAWSALAAEVEAYSDPPPVYVSPREVFSELTGFHLHQGCLAIAERGAAHDPRHLAEHARLLVALEDLADPDNVGGIFRNAQAFGVGAVWLGNAADPLYRKAVRVSLGATLAIPFAHARFSEDLAWLRDAGFTLVAAVADPSARDFRSLVPLPERICLLLGREERGLSPEALELADHRVTIPMVSGFDSLNVATASGILLQHLAGL